MLEDRIADMMKGSMKSGDKLKLSTMRLIISELKNKKIADGVKELDDAGVLSVIRKMAKQRKESIEKFAEGGRNDLVEKEQKELAMLEEFLPDQLSEEDVAGVVDAVISGIDGVSPKDMGLVMKEVMGKLQGQADGKVVSKLVQAKLAG